MNQRNGSRGTNHDDAAGLLGRGAGAGADALVQNLDETVLLGCIGLDADALGTADATLVCVVMDMSGSMSPHRAAVIDAYNQMLRALGAAKGATSILVSAWAFSDAPVLLSSYEAVESKPKLTPAVYHPNGSTALNDAVMGAMTGLVAYGERLWDEGVPTRRVLFVLTDGEDNTSKRSTAEVRTAATALARQEAYTLAYAGFGGDHAAQAAALGFPHVVSAGASDGELRKVFRQVSQSVLSVSRGTGLAGGFFAP
jgi:hypothetical protein